MKFYILRPFFKVTIRPLFPEHVLFLRHVKTSGRIFRTPQFVRVFTSGKWISGIMLYVDSYLIFESKEKFVMQPLLYRPNEQSLFIQKCEFYSKLISIGRLCNSLCACFFYLLQLSPRDMYAYQQRIYDVRKQWDCAHFYFIVINFLWLWLEKDYMPI